MTVKQDIISGGLTLDQDGFAITRVFIVDQVTGAGHARFKAAFDQVGIAYGTAHPSLITVFATKFKRVH